MSIPGFYGLYELGDGLFLIPFRAKFADESKIHVENLG